MSSLSAPHPNMTEGELEAHVKELCSSLHLYAYHCYDARRTSALGFPDWVFISANGVMYRELKNRDAPLKSDQRKVGYMLQASGQDWAVWRPIDLISGRIGTELRALKGFPS